MLNAFTSSHPLGEDTHACVQHLIEEQVRRAPDAVAIQFETSVITYDELNRRANQLARRLRDLGVAQNVLVGLCVERSIEMLIGLLGILKAGGAYVPLDPAYPPNRLSFMMTDSGLAILVTQASFAARFAIPPGIRTVCLDEPGVADLDDSDLTLSPAEIDPENIAYVIYTSGSTGKPKGVVVPHRALVNLLCSVRQRPGLTADDVVLAITTLSFDIAASELLLPLTVGARIVLAGSEDVSDGVCLRGLIKETGVTFVDATPSTWRLLIDAGWEGDEPLTAICTGEAMPRDLARELVTRAARVWNGYGPSETTVWSTFYEVTRPVDRILIGTPVANTRVLILDGLMQPVPEGEIGEMYIAGAGVASGYLGRPDLTAERFLPDPSGGAGATMYRTGDLGRFLSGGQIECLGRTDDQVKLRGFRIELGEIEETLRQHEAVTQAVVTARADRAGDTQLVGYVVLRDNAEVSDSAFRGHLTRSLPGYMIPAAFVRLDALPLGPTGKVDRRSLPLPSRGRHENRTFVEPRTPTEATLAGLWREALRLERVGVHDDFFALGGHSLVASHVLARLRRDFGIELLFRTIFEAPTIAELAQRIDSQPQSGNLTTSIIRRPAHAGATRLSVSQERMWLLEMMDPQQRVVHNLPVAWKLSGELNVRALEQSLNAIVARHAILRTRVTVREGVPFQEVSPAAAIALSRVDVRHLPDAQRDGAVKEICDREARTPHDLAVAPLLRATLIGLGPLEHVLVIVPHNLIWDGWSFDLFLRELDAFYGACCDGRLPGLPELSISYQDFAVWQRAWLACDASAQQRDWWATHLPGDLPVLEIFPDRVRSVEPTLDARHAEGRLAPGQVAALAAVAGNADGTLFTVLFATFCVLMHRLSGKDDILVGTPVHGRTHPETEEVMGPFTNMLVLRSRTGPESTFMDFLAQVRDMTLDALGHQELPLEALEGRAPILRAFFTMEDGRQRLQSVGRLSVQPTPVLPPKLAADLRLSVTEGQDGVSLAWTGSSELFDAATTDRFLERYQALLTSVLQDPHRKIGELELIPQPERQLLRTFCNLPSVDIAGVGVLALIEQQARETPRAPAVICGSDVIEYEELDRRAAILAQALAARAVGGGSRIACYLPRSVDLITSMLGVMKAGAVWVPLDLDDPPVRLAGILADSGAQFVLTNARLGPQLPPDSPPVLYVDEAAIARVGAPETTTGPAPEAGNAIACLLYACDAQQLRAIPISHRTVAALVAAVRRDLPLTEHDVALAILAPTVDASIIELLAPLASGARVVIAGADVPLDAERLAEALARSAATFVISPTELASDLMDLSATAWPKLKVICVGDLPESELASALAKRTAAAWIAHGFPEAGIWTSLRRMQDSEPPGVLGPPLPHVPVQILDSTLREVPLGVVGEVYIRVADLGERGAKERAGFVRFDREGEGPWYRTGERARWRSDGAMEIVVPRDRECRMGGFRVDLDDVSGKVKHELAARDATVVMQPQGAHARLVAHIVPGEGAFQTSTEWRRQLRRVLPDRLIPRAFIEVDAISANARGQLVPQAVAPAAGGSRTDNPQPGTPTEVLLARLWREALDLPRIGLHDNFFELGGYSLLCFQVLDRIERETGQRVNPRLLLLDSLQQVAAQLDEKKGLAHQARPRDRSNGKGFFHKMGTVFRPTVPNPPELGTARPSRPASGRD